MLAGRVGRAVDRAASACLVAAAAFVQMSTWQAGELALRTGPFRPADLALAACGLGFGIVIAPLAATVLQLTRTEHHGLASSLVVLARVMGMLVGLSALTAFGLFRFRQILGTPQLTEPDLRARLEHLDRLVAAAFLQEYREIFTIAAALCILAAAVIFIALRPRVAAGYAGAFLATAMTYEWWYRNASSGIAEAVHRRLDLGLQLAPVTRSKRSDQRVGKRAGAGHQLRPFPRVLRATACDHLGEPRDLEACRSQQLGQHVRLAESGALRAVPRQAQVVASRQRREPLKEEVLRARAQAAPLAGHRQPPTGPQDPVGLGQARRLDPTGRPAPLPS